MGKFKQKILEAEDMLHSMEQSLNELYDNIIKTVQPIQKLIDTLPEESNERIYLQVQLNEFKERVSICFK